MDLSDLVGGLAYLINPDRLMSEIVMLNLAGMHR